MTIPYRTLKSIGDDILSVLRRLSPDSVSGMISMIDYHGFRKSRLPHGFLQPILAPYQLETDDAEIEIVRVDTDLTGEVHYHEYAHAVIAALGGAEGFENAQRALAYHGEGWRRIQSGEELDIPPGTPHGFSVERGGVLWFLSIQAPPIVNHHGADDYHHVVPVDAAATL
jgi:mannose-6-phosphate isomerase-like protein (cupin superfamily)